MTRSLPAWHLAFILALSVSLTTCNSNTTSPTATTTTTTTSSGVSTTENYTGSLGAGGSQLYTFHTLPGTVTTTLVSISPTVFTGGVGLDIGTWDGTTCTAILGSAAATTGTILTGTATIETDLCVRIYDPGNFAPSFVMTYQITVVHQVASST